MRRKRAADKVTELRVDRLGHLIPLHRRIARWAKDNAKALREADPVLPAGVHGRAADNWRPLLAIADAAGGGWPERAREVAVALSGRASEDFYGVLLLEDLGRLFAESGVTRMSSVAICEALAKIEERPWGRVTTTTSPSTQPKLATLLKPFGIVPSDRPAWKVALPPKGYKLERLQDAISRYTSALRFPLPGKCCHNVTRLGNQEAYLLKISPPHEWRRCGGKKGAKTQGKATGVTV